MTLRTIAKYLPMLVLAAAVAGCGSTSPPTEPEPPATDVHQPADGVDGDAKTNP